MSDIPSRGASASRQLPPRPNLEHLRNEARQRLRAMRPASPLSKLADAQRTIAREYGFASWRKLKAFVDAQAVQGDRQSPSRDHAAIFIAARNGDVATVRRALESGFDPATTDKTGRTILQYGKQFGHEAIELLARRYQERDGRPSDVKDKLRALHSAASAGRMDELRQLLDSNPELINERGGDFNGQTALHHAAWRNRADAVRLLLDRGADVNRRDFGDNAYPLHFAAQAADLEVIRMLVEAGADCVGDGDDHQMGVLGWATCFRKVRWDAAEYLLAHGARFNLWSAIALGRADVVEQLFESDRSLAASRMSRSEHHRTALHHAVIMNQPEIVAFLLKSGADANVTDDLGQTPLAVGPVADARIIQGLIAAGARIDLVEALAMERFDMAEKILAADPHRIYPGGRDAKALCMAIERKAPRVARWLIDHGADVNAREKVWECAATPLHFAIDVNEIDLVRMLLEAGADPTIRDDKYKADAAGWADYFGRVEIAKLLKERAEVGSG